MPRRPQPILPFRDRGDPAAEITALANLGPKSAALLVQIGISRRAQLVDLGGLEICRRLKLAGHPVSLVLAYAIEASVIGCHWQHLPPVTVTQLRQDWARLKARKFQPAPPPDQGTSA